MAAEDTKKERGKVDGAQSIRRAAAIMRQIAHSVPQGADLSSISEGLGLTRSTTHRILQALVEEELISYNRSQRRYHAGQLTYELGLSASELALDLAPWRSAVDRAAQRTGATAYLLVRSGIEAVCVMKAESTSVIRVIPVELGQRRFLGFGAGALAMLAALAPEEGERVITAITPWLERQPRPSPAALREMVADARAQGYAVSHGNVTESVLGVGVAIPDAQGQPRLALSLAGLALRPDPALTADWANVLREEVAEVVQTR